MQSRTPRRTHASTPRTINQDGRAVKPYIVKPQQVSGKPGALFFIHGRVWIAGNFENHQRLVRDLVVGSGQVGVFPEYTPLPAAKFPTQLEESYAALKWVASHADEFGADGSRIAVAGVRILEGPRLELATDRLTVLKWTTDNPGGSDVHYGVVRYGTDPTDRSRTVKSPIRLNRGHRRTTFRIRLDDLEPRTTYYYRVASEESSGSSDGAQSAICKFTTPRPGERIVFVDRRM